MSVLADDDGIFSYALSILAFGGTQDRVYSIPEPTTALLLATGLAALAVRRRRLH